MNHWDTITEKGNAWKLLYAAYVAVEFVPAKDTIDVPVKEIEIEVEVKDEENEGQMKKVKKMVMQHRQYTVFAEPSNLKTTIENVGEENIEFWRLEELSRAFYKFLEDGREGKITSPTYKEYLSHKDVIKSVKLFGLNVKQFWYAILFVNWLTKIWGTNVVEVSGTIGEETQKVIDCLQDATCITIATEKKDGTKGKKITVSEDYIITAIQQSLNDLYAKNEAENWNDAYSFRLSDSNEGSVSATAKMAFSARRYLKLFENLNVIERKKGDDLRDSYNRMRFASRLIYHYANLTDNDKFKESDRTLKGIISEDNRRKYHIISPETWF
jgi:hypothetical protein